jgi:hypothetical protein
MVASLGDEAAGPLRGCVISTGNTILKLTKPTRVRTSVHLNGTNLAKCL